MAMSDNFLNNPTQTHSEENNKILETLELICDLLLETSSNNQSLPQLTPLIEFSNQINLNPLETALLALVNSADPDLEEVSEKFLIKKLRHFFNNKRSPIQQAIHNLVENKILIRERDSSNDLFIHPRFKKALNSGDFNTIKALQPKGLIPFLRNYIDQVLSTRHYHPFGMMTSPFDSDPLAMLNIPQNEHLVCVKYMKKQIETTPCPDIAILLYIAILAKRVVVDEPLNLNDFFHLIDRPHWEVKAFKKAQIHSENWHPIQMGYFEISGNDLMDDDIEIAITEEGIQELLPELSAEIRESLLEAKQITVPHRAPEKIAPIKLLFDKPTQLQLKPIQRMLQPQIRNKINETFHTQNKGISILLYGYPGTGKTEFCLQLAKLHNLPIMEVNVAQIQNKWVGESEKNARNVFKQYRKLRKQSQRECILLFNEADALFSKRVEVSSSVDSMNNALKNIFLEEMENMEGIILATTNLTGNLDAAFERRFLYKVGFAKPDTQTCALIWKNYFNRIPMEQATQLAKRFDFSPGEICNVRRKYDIEKILGNTQKQFDLICEISENEKIQDQPLRTKKAMGFG
ncbi:MAG: AAA family ATPase [Bacteroidetes bacterium]|nr:AAA family ATPase [Bacteroidota bacterium]